MARKAHSKKIPHAGPRLNQDGFSTLSKAAEQAFKQGDLRRAADLARRASQASPNSAEPLIVLAKIAGGSGRAMEAIELLTKAASIDPDNLEAWDGLFYYLRATGQLQRAAEVATRLISIRPTDPAAHFNGGLCEFGLERWARARNRFSEAAALDPNSASTWHYLGLSQAKLSQPREGIESLQRALAIDPESTPTLFHLGDLLISVGEREAGFATIQTAIEVETQAPALVELGLELIRKGFSVSAEFAFRRALQMDPAYALAWENLGTLLQARGDFAAARVALEEALKLAPDSSAPFYRLIAGGRVRAADQSLLERPRMLLAGDSISDDQRMVFCYALGKAYDDLDQPGEATKYFDQANQVAARLRPGVFREAEMASLFQKVERIFTPDFFARNLDMGVQSERPILVVGMLRSGTTLVEQILSTHPQVGAGAETVFWLAPTAKKRLFQALDGVLSTKEATDLAGAYLDLLSILAPDKTKVVDKQPNNYIALGLIHLLFPNARVIHCRRNPIDNCLSIYRTPYQEPPEFAFSRKNIVAAYRLYARLMVHWRNVLPQNRFLDIDYEDLVANTKAVTRRLIDFCGLPWDDQCLSYEGTDRLVQTPSFWQVRQPIYTGSVEKWRKYEPWLGEFRGLLDRPPER